MRSIGKSSSKAKFLKDLSEKVENKEISFTKLSELDNETKDEIEKISRKWSPYKSYACRILWKSLNNSPITLGISSAKSDALK